ncbi:hypothetical protein K8942_00455 [Candidatus Peribacteria bacterium]|nr:MAG: hypothetical protein K8942_00455 [Candidatus Peribacteria bacterium]
MLSRSSIRKVWEFNSQYGPGEDTFSPDWHRQNPVPQEGGVLQAAAEKTVQLNEEVVRVELQNVLKPKTIEGVTIDHETGQISMQTFVGEDDDVAADAD